MRFTRRAHSIWASYIPTAENFSLLPVQYAADEAAPIFVRFYIGTSRQPWRTGLKRWNQYNRPDSTFSLRLLDILVNSSHPYFAAGKLLISGLKLLFEKFFRKKDAPLTGAPAVRRLKTYSAQSGYVYQYCYEGQRPQTGDNGTEYVFHVSADRKNWRDCKVVVPAAAIAAWEEANGRRLSDTEHYAIAKMALFQAFDERATPALMYTDILVRAADVEGIVETLGL